MSKKSKEKEIINSKTILQKRSIRCYACKKKRGSAKKQLLNITIINRKTELEIKTKRITWTAHGFKRLGMTLWLCRECERNRCKKCDILLNVERTCRCGIKHGAICETNSNYCKSCFDIKKRSEKNNINN